MPERPAMHSRFLASAGSNVALPSDPKVSRRPPSRSAPNSHSEKPPPGLRLATKSSCRPPRSKLHIERSEEHRLNSSHGYISYAVFCLKKKKKINNYNKT